MRKYPNLTGFLVSVSAVALSCLIVIGCGKTDPPPPVKPDPPFVSIPAAVTMDAPAAVIAAQSNGPVKWFSCDDRLLVLIAPSDRSVVITSKVSGRYKLYAIDRKSVV